METILSASNNTLKLVKSLKLSKFRKQHKLFTVEGIKAYNEAVNVLDPVYTLVSQSYFDKNMDQISDIAIIVVDKLFDSVCDTISPQGIIGVFHIPDNKTTIESGVVLGLEDVQDPGNVGTMIRTADALGAVAVVLSSGCADIYSPKVIRSCMGSNFHLPVFKVEDFQQFLTDQRDKGFNLICGDLFGEEIDKKFKNAVLIIGNEGKGVTEKIKDVCDVKWKIEQKGDAESLNASIAAGIMLYRLI